VALGFIEADQVLAVVVSDLELTSVSVMKWTGGGDDGEYSRGIDASDSDKGLPKDGGLFIGLV
jgi:hypothetical protein